MRVNLTLLCAFVSFFVFACSSASTITQAISSQPDISPEARTLFKKADVLYKEGKFLESARTGELALRASQGDLPTNTADTVRLEIAGLYEKGGSPNDAIRVLKVFVKHSPASDSEQLIHARALYYLGRLLYFRTGQLDQASRHLAVAEDLARKSEDPTLLFWILNQSSLIEVDLDQHEAAISTLTEALAVLPRVKNPGPKARLLILNQLFWQYSQLDRYAEAEVVASEYLKEAKDQGDLEHQAKALEYQTNTLFLQGDLKHRQGDLQGAVDAFFAAARKASEQPDRAKAMRYFWFGFAILEDLKKYDEMKDALLVALDRYDQVFEERQDKADLLLQLGQVLIQLGVYDTAQMYLLDAYQLYRDVANDTESARVMVLLGRMMKSLNDPRNAFTYFATAKKHASDAQNADALAVVHKQRGLLYARVGWYVDAYREYEEARKIYSSLGRYDRVYDVEFLTIELYRDMGDRNKVREQLGRLDEYRNRVPSLTKDSWYWVGLSTTYLYLGGKDKAKEYASHALTAAREAKDAKGQIYALELLARLVDAHESIPLLQEAYSIAEKNHIVGEYGTIRSRLGYSFLKEGMVKEAIGEFNDSIAATESAVGRIPFAETRVSFAAKSLSPYDGLITALYLLYERGGDQDLAEKALLVHEKSRAREFARTLTESRREEIAKTLPENVYAEEQTLAKEIDTLERETFKLVYSYDRNDRLLERKEGDLEAKRELYTILMRTIQERYPQYAITKRRDLGNVKNLSVRPDEALLVYRVITGGVFVWAITPGRSGAEIRSFARINTNIRLPLWKALEGFYLREDPDSISQESLDLLSDQLLKPVLSTLTTASRLTIVRDGALAQLPFEMLPSPDDSKQMVLDRWMVGYYPSLLSMMVIRTSAQSEKEFGEKVLLVGDAQYKLTPDTNQPDNVKGAKRVKLRSGKSLDELPYSAVEIRRIGELFRSRDLQTTILRRSAASEGRIKQLKLEEYKYLHFAVHGLLAYEVIDVGEPSLALSVGGNGDNGFLTASEVMGLRLNAELAVLSACDTALGEYHPGEGYANLARAFMSAGAESVIVSQWAVEDQSTAELMVELYRNLAKGLSVPEALKAAKITLRKQYPSPYYWAPFVLMGG